jgi:spoIIIJ-associated protein
MRQTEQTAKTVEEAIEQGLQILGVKREDVEIQVLEEPTGGIFGIGAKQARVRLLVKEANVEKAQKVLEDILKILNLQATVDVVENQDNFRFEITGENLGILIGHRGQTLNALQFFLSLVLGKGLEGKKVNCTLDVEGYRARRERALQILAEKMAQRVSTERRSIALEPMLPHERRIIHLALQNHPYVTTASQGKEPLRKVVISPKEGGKPAKGKARRREKSVSKNTSSRKNFTPRTISSRWEPKEEPLE